jgi:hypothetical protein
MHWKFLTSRFKKAPKRHSRPNFEELESRQIPSTTSAVFAVDPSASAVTLSGDVSGATILPQGTGSLTSNYSGTLVADWDLGAQTINFDQPGTAVSASITGNWQPQIGGGSGSAPANYGGKATLVIFPATVALRNLVLTGLTASPLALSGPGPYSFPSTQTFKVAAGTADYNAGFLGFGSTDLSGLSSDNQSAVAGTFEDLGNGSYRVTEPINLTLQQTISGLAVTLHIQGQIVATAGLPVINLSGSGSSFDYATSAVGGAGPVPTEDPTATVTGTALGNLTSMTITLLNHPDDTAELLSIQGYDLTNSPIATTGYDPTTGQLVLSGSADPSVYQDVLRAISYEDDSTTPDTSDRMIQFVASDGVNTSVVRTTTVSVSAPSPAPPPAVGGSKPTPPSIVSDKGAIPTPLPVIVVDHVFVTEALRRSEGPSARLSGGGFQVPFDRMLSLEALAAVLGGLAA